MRTRYVLPLATVAILVMTTSPRGADEPKGEWRTYAGSNSGSKYSPLDQINKDNVKDLRIVWRQSAVPMELRRGRSSVALPTNFQVTPLMVGGLMYMTAGDSSIVALNPATGAVVWTYVPPELLQGDSTAGSEPAKEVLAGRTGNRGLAYWADGSDARIVGISGQSLIALNAKTGELVPDFGTGGRVDLTKGYRRPAASIRWTSLPVIVKDIIVVGGMANGSDGAQMPGDIRAYDVRSGRPAWTFKVIPEYGEFGNDTWLKDSYAYSGASGVWGLMSADDELGYLYIATETPTAQGGDFWGGKRPGANLFAESLVCIDARTGKRIWHFQGIHHGIWDYDFTSAPNLVDITVNGRRIKAVAEVSKQAFTYVFDRVTGNPVWPIEERSVPAGNVPGEWYSPTQPHPTKPPAFDRQGVKIDDLIDFTPELRQEAIKILDQYRWGPVFTPPTVAGDGKKGSVQIPGAVGGANWTGAGVDPETGILYVPSVTAPFIAEMVRTADLPPQAAGGQGAGAGAAGDGAGGGGAGGGAGGGGAGRGAGAGAAGQAGGAPTQPQAPPAEWRTRPGPAVTGPWLEGPQGLPIFKPPYGRLTAIDLNKGDILWTAANGNGPRDHPAIKHLNLPPLGQPGRVAVLITKSMLFLGEGGNNAVVALPPFGGGKMFRAYDKATGKVLWETELPAGTTGAPMTYMFNGKQYIVVAVGWKDHASELVALALP